MKVSDLIYEARRNPEQNPKINILDKLIEYADDPSMFIHTTSVDKVGINPKTARSTSDDTPAGIFAFHLATYKSQLIKAKENGWSLTFVFPFVGGDNVFVLKSNEPYVDTLKNYSDSDLKVDIEKLKEKYGETLVSKSLSIASSNENYVKSPIGDLWGMTKAIAIGGTSELSHQQYPNPMKWHNILRYLGFETLNDSGYGWLHGAESAQTLFLTVKAFTVVDKLVRNRKQKTYTIGRKEYVGGRLPKHLVLDNIDSTELANIERDETTKKVQTITIPKMTFQNISGIPSLQATFPNSSIIIDEFIGDVAMFERLSDRVVDFFKKLNINKFIFSRTFPGFPRDLKTLATMTTNTKSIMYTDGTTMPYRDKIEVDKLPDEIKTKLQPYSK